MGGVAFVCEKRPCGRGSASPFEIVLTPDERQELERHARAYTGFYWQVVRAKIVLLATEGMVNVEGRPWVFSPLGQGRDQSSGLRAAGHQRGAVVALDLRRAGSPADRRRRGSSDLSGHHMADTAI